MSTKKSLGKVELTARNFEYIAFKDYNGESCSLQASSLAIYEQPGISAVWLGIEGNRMHLTDKQVALLVKHLDKWLTYGTFKLP